MNTYQTQSPILFLIFNRPDTTSLVYQEIRAARPARLYIAADGPRADKPSDSTLCEATIMVLNDIDWDCEVKRLYRNENLGCKEAVSTAIDWFFEHEEEGIILEDDCVPAPDFFRFCDEMLKKYRFDTRIRHITGCNMQLGKKFGNASYYFTHQTHVWGWASWRRVWEDYDKTLNKFDDKEAAAHLDKIFDDALVAQEWKTIFTEVKKGSINTWDYQLALINYFNNSLSINPNVNLIKNIGFREDGTHTHLTENPYGDMKLESIGNIDHPKFIVPEKEADNILYEQTFNLEYKRKLRNVMKAKLRNWIKQYVKNPA